MSDATWLNLCTFDRYREGRWANLLIDVGVLLGKIGLKSDKDFCIDAPKTYLICTTPL